MKKLSAKKTAAAAVAAAVGAALLLGGAGTLAYWNDEVTSDDQTISAGELDLGTITGGGWVHESTGSAVTTIVPGDTVTTTVSVPVTLAGDNIAATFLVEKEVVTDELGEAITVDIDVNESGTASLDFAGTADTLVPVTVTVDFPFGSDADNESQLSDYEFTLDYSLTQVATATAVG